MKQIACLWIFLVFLASCGQDSGPIKINWDRDACEYCKMVISDQHFAVQVQGGADHKVYLFDDLGCAIHWLARQPWREEKTTKIWVADHQTGHWLEARQAYYVPGQITPMAYGFGATATPLKGSVDFQTVMTQILTKSQQKHLH